MLKYKIAFVCEFLFFVLPGVLAFVLPAHAQALPTETPTLTPTPTGTATPPANPLATVLAPVLPPGIIPATDTPAPPGLGTPGTITPGAGTPGAGTPGTGTPGTGTPGTGTPGTGASQPTPANAGTPSPASSQTPDGTLTPRAHFTFTPAGPTRTPEPALIVVHPRVVAGQFVQAFLIGGIGLGIAWLVQRLIFRLLARAHPEIQVFTGRFAFIAIIIAAALRILSVFSVDATTLATVLGSLGLALSLSAQDLFKNLIAGIYLLLEHPFVVGDVISIGAYTGQVVVVDMRTITLRTDDQQLVIVPNTLVMSQVVVRKIKVSPPISPPEDRDITPPRG